MKPGSIEYDIERTLTYLRNLIRHKGFTQLEVQGALGWGRSYISQLLTGQKSLRLEQILMVLRVIDVDPAEFFLEVFSPGERLARHEDEPSVAQAAELRDLAIRHETLVDVLKRKRLLTDAELAKALRKSRLVA